MRTIMSGQAESTAQGWWGSGSGAWSSGRSCGWSEGWWGSGHHGWRGSERPWPPRGDEPADPPGEKHPLADDRDLPAARSAQVSGQPAPSRPPGNLGTPWQRAAAHPGAAAAPARSAGVPEGPRAEVAAVAGPLPAPAAAVAQPQPPQDPASSSSDWSLLASDLAAAAAQAAEASGALAHGLPVYDEAYFREWRNFTARWPQHNAALKYFVEQLEDPNNPGGSKGIRLEAEEPAAVAAIEPHVRGAGMEWQFDHANFVQWDWKEMVAQLRDHDITRVVRGPKGSSGGLVGCSVLPRPNSYDHNRHRVRHSPHWLPSWDFLLHRADGSGIRLHPRRTSTNVETFLPEGHPVQVQTPWNGLGRSDGPGTVKWYKERDQGIPVKFDGQKQPPGVQGKGKGKGKGKGRGA